MPDTSLSALTAATATTSTPSAGSGGLRPNPQAVSRETFEYVQRAAWRQGVLGAVNVLALVLSVRLILLVAITGAISLTVIAIRDPDPWRMAALGIYALTVVVPTVWLSSRR